MSYQGADRFNESHVWLGQSMPNAQSDFWDDNFHNFEPTAAGSRVSSSVAISSLISIATTPSCSRAAST